MGRHRRGRPQAAPVQPQAHSRPQAETNIRRLRAGVAFTDLTVDFKNFRLGPLSLRFAASNLTCLVGPNGSGKTTLIRALMGIVKLSAGEVLYDAMPMSSRPPDLLRLIGFVPDGPDNLVPELTARELWELHALAHSRVTGSFSEMMTQAEQLAHVLDLRPSRATIRSYSHGMQKKTQLIASLMHKPDYLILDEPRNGLDPIAGEKLDRLVAEECGRGATVILATHDLRYAARVAHSVVVLNRGQCTAVGSPDQLRMTGERDFVDTFFRLVRGERP
jgi:ABC-2 type transport system ATP-binding protein